jgi:pimeloyl-ACP methyl ester carboxylesterase
VKCPVLFVLGKRDVMTPPRAAEALLQKLPNAKTELVELSGHSLMAEAPDATLDALIQFFGA